MNSFDFRAFCLVVCSCYIGFINEEVALRKASFSSSAVAVSYVVRVCRFGFLVVSSQYCFVMS